MRYEFTKMQSLGNDFIIIDGVSKEVKLTTKIAQSLADRHFGIGCDQVLLVQTGQLKADEFIFRIFNQDGSEVGQCGNGARCLATFLHERRLTKRKTMNVRTHNACMKLIINPDETVSVEMGVPEFQPSKIPFLVKQTASRYVLDLGDQPVEISALSIGNPHAVLRVPDISQALVATHGPLLENHAQFPDKANVGFMRIAARNHIYLRVHERGVGETLGCGSGACAAVAAGVLLDWLDCDVRVSLPGGDVTVNWQGENHPIFLTGPTHTVFHGVIEL